MLVVECDCLQSVGKKSRFHDPPLDGFKLQMLDGIVLCYEMRGISILTPIRPEDVSISVFLGICEDYHAVSDLKAGGARLTDEETQDCTGEIPAFAGDRHACPNPPSPAAMREALPGSTAGWPCPGMTQ